MRKPPPRFPVVYATPPSARPPRAPNSRLLAMWAERKTPKQWARLALAGRSLAAQPAGLGRPVLLVPGFRAPESSLYALRTYLRWLGHAAVTWGFGTNRGRVWQDQARTLDVVRQMADTAGQPVALVGWSLGGVICREVARVAPEQVRCVVTYGSPIVGGPGYTLVAHRFPPDLAKRAAADQARLDREQPLSVPITAIFTKQDRIVDWPACIDRQSARVTHVEVGSTHVGMGIDPDVWQTVAQALR